MPYAFIVLGVVLFIFLVSKQEASGGSGERRQSQWRRCL